MSWGRLLDSFRNETGKFHLLKGDGSPSCGTSYFTSTGPYPFTPDDSQKCKNCIGVEQARSRKHAPQR